MVNTLNLIVDLAIVLIVPLLTYVSYLARKIYSKLKTHDRVLFGEPDVDQWNGLLGEHYGMKDKTNTVINNQSSIIRQLQDQELLEVHDIRSPGEVREEEVRGAGFRGFDD